MNAKIQYTEAFRQQALQKLYSRGERSVKSIAEELNLNHWTLKNWMKSKSKPDKPKSQAAKRPNDCTPAERLEALMVTHAMDEQALGHYCRRQGIFTHHLKQWRSDFEAGASPVNTPNV